MVRVGFVVEGTSDFIILKSDKFQNLLQYKIGIESNEDLIRKAGSKPKIKTNFKSYILSLQKNDVDYIFVLVDQDSDDCPIVTRDDIINYRDNKHYHNPNITYIVMTREMEAWFLADENLGFEFEGAPEENENPSELLQSIFKTSNHVMIASKVKEKFSLVRAAENSPSANRFFYKLKELGENEE